MAGAISAGAYSAGAFDFLIEALEAWTARKDALRGKPKAEWDVPDHEIVIPVISGASAGGITGALGVVAASEAAQPYSQIYPQAGAVTATTPRLFRAWVKGPAFVKPEGEPDLLGITDLKGGKALRSLLDTTVLNKIVRDSLTNITAPCVPKRYLSDNLHLFLTQTNTRGVPYSVTFVVDDVPEKKQGYQMLCHADRIHFGVRSAGLAPFVSSWADVEQPEIIDLKRLRGLKEITTEWLGFSHAALGTSAFPVGLSARKIRNVTLKDYYNRQWPLVGLYNGPPGMPTRNLEPDFPESISGNVTAPIPYVSIDGGTINNEPFELARWTLMETPPRSNTRDKEHCDRAVVMIDPFPEPPSFDDKLDLNAGLVDVLKGLLPTLKNQARFKADDLVDALDDTIGSRFLIAPRRRVKKGNSLGPPETHAIACGLLGGFGGFLDEELRAHDYQLGRANCYYFLRDSFVLPASNDVLATGYGASAAWHTRFMPTINNQRQAEQRQIIPVLPPAPVMPTWPRVDNAVVEKMVTRAIARAGSIVARIAADTKAPWTRRLLPLAWRWFGVARLREFIRWTVLQDLIRRDQFKWSAAEAAVLGETSEAERLTLAALADPNFDFRTAAGIAKGARRDVGEIAAALKRVGGIVDAGPATPDGASFTLKARRPTGLASYAVVRYLDENLWSGPPAID